MTGDNARTWLTETRLAAGIFGVLLVITVAVASTARQDASQGPNGVGQPRQAPVTIGGSGIENSAPFHLNAGDYRVAWTATPDHDTGCYHGADLESAEVDVFEPLGNELLDSSAPLSGSTYIYGLEGASYYIRASSGCSWTYTFTQQ